LEVPVARGHGIEEFGDERVGLRNVLALLVAFLKKKSMPDKHQVAAHLVPDGSR
jgi:hypothetical protein